MSGRLSRNIAIIGAVVLVAATALAALADRPQKKPREAMAVTQSAYVVIQNGEEKGTENIIRTDYNDNTVTFQIKQTLSPVPQVNMEQDTELILEEESFFPVAYHMQKRIEQGDSKMQMEIDVEMFANVAVVTTSTGAQSGTRNIVVPTGAALIETGVVYVYHQLLFWYDRDLSGRQNFEVLDVSTGKPGNVVVQFLNQQTVNVGGQDYVADAFRVEREAFDATVFVDADGRIVRVDQNYMNFDITEWSREVMKKD
jgi:hypothetical protein